MRQSTPEEFAAEERIYELETEVERLHDENERLRRKLKGYRQLAEGLHKRGPARE